MQPFTEPQRAKPQVVLPATLGQLIKIEFSFLASALVATCPGTARCTCLEAAAVDLCRMWTANRSCTYYD